MFKKHAAALIIAASAVIAALVIGVLAFCDAEFRYTFTDRLKSIGKGDMPAETAVAAQKAVISDIAEDPRFHFSDAMMLINEEHPLADDFKPDIAEYRDTEVYMNACVTDAYGELSDEIKSRFGEKLYISSSYRTAEEQQRQIEEEGELAQKVGASEHQAGLGLDVYVMYYGGAAFLKHEVGRWVNSNCSDYGFIIRYPYYGEKETGISYEPWHLRYVGQPHARIIAENRITLEEYIVSLRPGVFYSYESGGEKWLILRTNGDELSIPDEFISAEISKDNTGGYVVTFRT